MADPALADCVLVFVTVPEDGADALARDLVDARVAACVSVLPVMTSTYQWEGQIEREREHQLIIKTTSAGVPALWDRVRDLHPFDVPEFVVVPIIDGNAAYLQWVRTSVE